MRRALIIGSIIFLASGLALAGTVNLRAWLQNCTGTCKRVAPDFLRCSVKPGARFVIRLEALTDPAEWVEISGEGVPEWGEFKTSGGLGRAEAECVFLMPPDGSATRTVFCAQTKSGFSTSLLLELTGYPQKKVTSDTSGEDHGVPLGWDDFRGTPPMYPQDDTVAQIVYELRFHYAYEVSPMDDSFAAYLVGTEVELVIRRDLSWVYPWAKTAEVLRHERGHLALGEVYRVLLEIQLKGLRTVGTTPDQAITRLRERVSALFENVRARMERTQSLYDDATSHGKDAEAQKEWDEKILFWLKRPSEAP